MIFGTGKEVSLIDLHIYTHTLSVSLDDPTSRPSTLIPSCPDPGTGRVDLQDPLHGEDLCSRRESPVQERPIEDRERTRET